MRRSALITAVGLMLASLAPAHAQQPQASLPLTFAWHAPAECAQADEVRAELARITRVRAGFTLTPLDASAEVQRTAQGYATLLRTERDGERGERKLEANDCRTLVRTVTLVLALAFGAGVELTDDTGTGGVPASPAPERTTPGAESSPVEPTPTESEPAPEAPLTPPSTPSPPASEAPSANVDVDLDVDVDDPAQGSPSSLDLAFIFGAAAQLGPLPSPALALLAGAELAHGAFALELRVHALPALQQSLSSGVRTRFDGLGGAALGCGQLPQGPVTLALCAGARAAALRGRSSGASDDASATAPWYALSAAGAAVWPSAGLLRLRLEATLSVSLSRPRFVIVGLGPAHRVPQLAPELALLLVLAP